MNLICSIPNCGHLAEEKWKVFEDRGFAVSNIGRVKTLDRHVRHSLGGKSWKKGKLVKDGNNGNGYRYVSINLNGARKNYYVHRLVAQAFINNPYELPQVNHIDGDKSNNHVSNLEWCSVMENRSHAVRMDLVPFGEDSPHAKLTESQVIEILTAYKENPKLNKRELARKYNVWDPHIHRIIIGKRWARTFKKFHKL